MYMSPEQIAEELRLARSADPSVDPSATQSAAALLALAELAVSVLRMIDAQRERGVRFGGSYNEDVLRDAVAPLAAQEFPPGPPMRLPKPRAPDERRDRKLVSLLDAARELIETSGDSSRLRMHALEALETAVITWGADECPICGRRGDHEWEELTDAQRLAHEAEDASQGR